MSNTELATVSEKSLEGNHMRISRLDDSLFSKELAPHYMKLAGQLASSELVPKSFRGKPQDLFLCWAIGYSIGMSPEQSMQCIAIINGRACMWGDEMLALCMAHKEFDDIVEEPILKDAAVVGYTCTVKRKGKADKMNVFTLDMAKKAGLLAKGGVWTQYPERMLKLRARGFSLRDAFPDALKGIKSREEVEDYIDAEYKVVDSGGSRTELLKKDFLTKTGRLNEITEPTSDLPTTEETAEDPEPQALGATGGQEAVLHDEIKRLIEEKGFSEERLVKALAYYEVDSIESLPEDLAEHFIAQLNKS
jgi:hypothetical protein